MSVRTYIEKNQIHGWQARSTVSLGIKLAGRDLVLDITSNKPKEGGIASLAMASRMDAKGELEHHIGQDYRKLTMYDPKARCTQRNLQEQHSGVLKIFDLLAAEALAIYAMETITQD